jgi:DNA topoisomerase-1
LQVLNGRFGPYICKAGTNYKIVKGTDAAALTYEDCLQIINNQEPSKGSKKKAAAEKKTTGEKKAKAEKKTSTKKTSTKKTSTKKASTKKTSTK